MAHKAGLILGQISLSDFKQLKRLKPMDPDAYERLERRLGTTRPQLVRKYGEARVAAAEKDPVGTKIELLRKEGTPERQAVAIGISFGRYVGLRRFGTRKDGRRYPKR